MSGALSAFSCFTMQFTRLKGEVGMARRSRLFGKLVSVVCAASLCTTLSFPCEALGGTDEETVGLAGNGGEISVAQDADLSPETSNVDAGSSEVIEGEAASNSLNVSSESAFQAISLISSDDSSAVDSLFDASLHAIKNSTHATLVIPSASELLSREIADSVSVQSTMSYGGRITRSVSQLLSLKDYIEGGSNINFGTYGRFTVSLTFFQRL